MTGHVIKFRIGVRWLICKRVKWKKALNLVVRARNWVPLVRATIGLAAKNTRRLRVHVT